MQRAWVKAAFNPRGAAVVGSCSDPSKLAWGTLQALQRGLQRPIVAVDRHINNPQSNSSRGDTATTPTTIVANPGDVPVDVAESIDLAVLVASRDRCIGRMGECIDAFPNLKAVNIVSGGFREAQHEHLEEQIVDIARDSGIRLIGPNSVGTIDTYSNFQSMFLRTFPKRGGISLISQSGGVCGSVVELLANPCRGLGMNKVISVGNAADVGFAETLMAIGEDERTRVVLLYLEGLRDADEGEAFVRCARQISSEKPIIALKAGSSKDAARAVSSHTGALAGNQMVYEAALRRAGIVQATSLREMLDIAQALSCHPSMPFCSSFDSSVSPFDRKYQVAVVTNAGGPAALAVDALTKGGAASIPSLPPKLQKEISSRPGIHVLSSTSNPVDLLGGATPRSYRSAVEACMSDDSIDAVLALHVPTALLCPEELATELVTSKQESQDSTQKPLLGLFVSDDREYITPALSVLTSASIPTSCHAEGIAAAFNAWKQREEGNRLFLAEGKDGEHCLELSESQIQRCREYISHFGSGWVLEHNARILLDILGIEQAKAELLPISSCAIDVLDAAEKFGYPVVLKRVDRVHKSTAGGVAVNLQNPEQVVQALQQMFPENEQFLTAPVLVCEYISAASFGLKYTREFLVGAIRDDIFGHAMCFGTGGALAEAVKDVAFVLPPETRLETLDLLNRSRLAHSKLQRDNSIIAATVEKISALVQAFPAIAELDMNPLIVGQSSHGETRAIAVDVKFRLEK